MHSAIIVAAGRGKRMGSDTDKLFLEVCGRPVIAHTWSRFENAPCIHEIVLVIRPDRESEFQALARAYRFVKPFRLIAGGAERQDSVWNGLGALDPAAEIVAIHDGARPCTPLRAIDQVVGTARSVGAAVLARRVTDTIKESDGGEVIDRTLDRSRLWTVQTPQAFRVPVIRHALEVVRQRGLRVTDDTAACELINQMVRLVEVPGLNPKVTVQEDLVLVEALLRQGSSWPEAIRPGNGGLAG
jgi:2-C-methyl-D-erythritol 4-phosphate cytidylyltransferase